MPKLEGFKDSEVTAIKELLSDAGTAIPIELAKRLVDILGFELNHDLQQMLNTLVRFKGLSQALVYFDKIAESGYYDPAADAITLLTIHASKGLEFSHVFLIGCEEGILPHSRADKAEEKRLFYVALTRAKQNLTITHAMKRAGQSGQISNFAASIPDDILPKIVDPDLQNQAHLIAKKVTKKSQQSLF